MAAKKAPKDESKRMRKYSQDGSVPTVYANDFGLEWTPWDFNFRFGQLVEATEKELNIKRLVDVYLSPQHVLAVIAVLQRQVRKYEETVGPIPLAGAAKESADNEDD